MPEKGSTDPDGADASGRDGGRGANERDGEREKSGREEADTREHEEADARGHEEADGTDVDDRDTVLIVEDEAAIANLYSQWLADTYEVRVANTGREGLDALDGGLDVVLLDRRLPDISGREVLDEIRTRALDCQVAMVTAVDPDVDVLEMGFDDYVTKPMSRDDLQSLVANLVARSEYSAYVQRYFRLLSKRAALQRELDTDIAEHPEYHDLHENIATVEATLDDLVGEFTEIDFDAQFYRFSDSSSTASD